MDKSTLENKVSVARGQLAFLRGQLYAASKLIDDPNVEELLGDIERELSQFQERWFPGEE